MRSNTCGGGPSIWSKAIVAPSLAAADPVLEVVIANEALAPPLPAQPPRVPAHIISNKAAPARNVVRLIRSSGVDASLIIGSDIVKID
jgi:hypothetical protein